MRMRTLRTCVALAAAGLVACAEQTESPLTPELGISESQSTSQVVINVGLNTDATDEIRAELAEFGTIAEELPQIDVVFMVGQTRDIRSIAKLPFVAYAEEDSEVDTGPLDAELASDFLDGLSMWNLDAVNVTQPGFATRQVAQTGAGVYVGVLDTGLLHTWRLYFPEERIAEEYATAFGGGWHPNAENPELPNQWENDVNSHGTHVTSTIIGFDFNGTPVTGVAPEATIIPVKVLGQTGSGFFSMVAAGIIYIADLKANELSGSPVVINMSLGGGESATAARAVDYAIERGVVVVASAGNSGTNGMGFPGSYEPVISAGSAGWGDCPTFPNVTSECYGQWAVGNWWWSRDVQEGSSDVFYISGFSARELAGQDLDVIAPGHWVVGPFQLEPAAATSYFFLSGTSMASPHVAGIVALMLEQDPTLTGPEVEDRLEAAATPMAPGTHHPLAPVAACCFEFTWGDDATGHGFITADAALGLTSSDEPEGKRGRR
ncbi:MAG TPA: S8 family serine peptidase [Longimicrobiales bacterium]|nr:S8 family serine peptidase [Longimicrobiales bacterium]